MGKITIVLGELEGPLQVRLKKLKLNKSEYVRRVLARDLGVQDPELKAGRPKGK
jgi:hypothetical protein